MEIAIFTKMVAEQLEERGFKIVRVGGRNEKIFYFVDSDELRIALDEILENCSQV